MTRFAFAYPVFLLAGGIVLIQYHGIAFWNDAVGPATGWAWSVLLELIALWLWYQPRTRLLALVATALVLSGPLYQVTTPLVQQLAASAAERVSGLRRAALLRQAIATEESALQTFLANSSDRAGWLPPIEQARASLDAKRAELQALLTPTRQTLPWQQIAAMGLQAIALVLVQVSNVLAITTLSRTRETPAQRKRKPVAANREMPRSVPLETPKTLPNVAQIQAALRQHLSAEGISARTFAERHGFSARDISLVFHDQENQKAGKRRAPSKVFGRLAEMLEASA